MTETIAVTLQVWQQTWELDGCAQPRSSGRSVPGTAAAVKPLPLLPNIPDRSSLRPRWLARLRSSLLRPRHFHLSGVAHCHCRPMR